MIEEEEVEELLTVVAQAEVSAGGAASERAPTRLLAEEALLR